VILTDVLAEPQFGKLTVMELPEAGEPEPPVPRLIELKESEICDPGVRVNELPGDRMAAAVVEMVQAPPAVATSPVTAAPVPVVVPAN